MSKKIANVKHLYFYFAVNLQLMFLMFTVSMLITMC